MNKFFYGISENQKQLQIQYLDKLSNIDIIIKVFDKLRKN